MTGQQEYRITEVCGCNDDSCPHHGEFEEKGWDDWGLHPRYPYCYKADKPIPETIGKEGFEAFPDWCPLSRPVQSEQAIRKDERENFAKRLLEKITDMEDGVQTNNISFDDGRYCAYNFVRREIDILRGKL